MKLVTWSLLLGLLCTGNSFAKTGVRADDGKMKICKVFDSNMMGWRVQQCGTTQQNYNCNCSETSSFCSISNAAAGVTLTGTTEKGPSKIEPVRIKVTR